MGQAMLEGWLARGLNARKVTVIEPQPAKAVKALARRGLKLNPKPSAKSKVAPAAVVVFAVKPQIAAEALPAAAAYVGKATLALSIMAGRTIGFIESVAAGRRRGRARHAQHAGGDRPRHYRGGRQPQRLRAPAPPGNRPARGHRRGGMGQ